MEYFTLSNGVKMPALGYGAMRMKGTVCEEAILAALESGYRLIDTATAYGNEASVGHALKTSGIPRQEIFVTTKLIRCGSEALAKADFERSLDALGLDYVDLYLIHQPYGDVFASWRAMESLYAQGKARAIGVCNFTDARLADLICNNEIMPVINQIELNPFISRSTSVSWQLENDIRPEAWGPLAQGRSDLYENGELKRIAAGHGKTVAQVVLRWHFQRGVVAIPMSSKPERMKENIDIFDFELSTEEMQIISSMDEGTKPDIHDDPAFVKHLCGEWDLKNAIRAIENG